MQYNHKAISAPRSQSRPAHAPVVGFCSLELVCDRHGDPVDLGVCGMNQALAGLFSAELDALEGRLISDLCPSALSADHLSIAGRVLATGEPAQVRVRMPGKSAPLDLCCVLARSQQSLLSCAVIDMTELVAARQQAETAAAAQRASIANVSHEIRTPLNGVLGMAEAMALEPLPPRARDMLEVIRRAGRELMRVLNDVIDLSRIEAGGMPLQAAAFSPGDLLRKLGALFEPTAGQKGLAFTLSVTGDDRAQRLGDAARISQILNNLVANAIKFTDRGEVSVRATIDAWGMRVAVRDTGVGVPEEELDKVFQRFAQADHALTRGAGGAGLGLAIARNLARAMGGDIALDSRPGAGSTFTLSLPLEHAGAAPEAAPADDAPDLLQNGVGRLEGARVLVADDHPTNRMVVELLLRGFGVEVRFAQDGQEAVTRAAQAAFDAILMDISMPVLNGVAAMQRIRAAEAATGARTPIIAMTANAMSHQVADYLAAGMDDVVTKPLTPEPLVRALLGVMSTR